MYKTGHAFSYLLLKEIVADDVINVSSFAGPVCCEQANQSYGQKQIVTFLWFTVYVRMKKMILHERVVEKDCKIFGF